MAFDDKSIRSGGLGGGNGSTRNGGGGGPGGGTPNSGGQSDPIEDLPALKQRVFRLLHSSAAIDNLSAQVGSPGDSKALRQRIFRECQNAASLLKEIEDGIRRLRVSIMQSGNSTAQRDLDRVAEEYSSLKARAVECVRQSQGRQRQFAPPPQAAGDASLSQSSGPGRGGPGGGGGNQQLQVRIELRNFSAADDLISEVCVVCVCVCALRAPAMEQGVCVPCVRLLWSRAL